MPSECHSIKGDPATVVMRLGSVYNIEDISQKFDSIYSNVFGTEDNLAEFYSAKQKDTEDCATWSIRLEYLLINIAIITKGTTERASMNAIYQTVPHIFGRQGGSLKSIEHFCLLWLHRPTKLINLFRFHRNPLKTMHF